MVRIITAPALIDPSALVDAPVGLSQSENDILFVHHQFEFEKIRERIYKRKRSGIGSGDLFDYSVCGNRGSEGIFPDHGEFLPVVDIMIIAEQGRLLIKCSAMHVIILYYQSCSDREKQAVSDPGLPVADDAEYIASFSLSRSE